MGLLKTAIPPTLFLLGLVFAFWLSGEQNSRILKDGTPAGKENAFKNEAVSSDEGLSRRGVLITDGQNIRYL